MTASYDKIAAWYDESVRDGSLLHDLVLPALFEEIGDVADQRICDLACGQGIVARRLARQGAHVVGIDVSEQLLAMARRYERDEPLGIVYRRDDAEILATCPDAAFDGVVCNMALMDIAGLDAAFRSVRRVLRPAGWFVFAITHPCFQTPRSSWLTEGAAIGRVVGDYFVEGPWRSENATGVRGQVGAHHRTLSTYVNSLSAAGLQVERMLEPQAHGAIAGRIPGYIEMPAALVVHCIARDSCIA